MGNNIEYVGDGAFAYCRKIKTLSFPNIEYLGSTAFAECDRLEELTLSDKITTFYADSVYGCENLTLLTIPNAECEIIVKEYILPTQTILSSYTNSKIELFANENNFHFIPIDGENAGKIQNHQFSTLWSEVLPATCTERGLKLIVCKICGGVDSKVITPLGHDMRDYIVTTPATCKESGLETSKCSRCDKTDTKIIPTESHSYSTIVIEPTCSTKGFTAYICGCGYTYNDNYVNVLNHKDDNADYLCDYNCGFEYENTVTEKPADPTPDEPEVPDEPTVEPEAPDEPEIPDTPNEPDNNCSCNCHKGGLAGLFFKIINFFQKLFGKNKVCTCGVAH